MSSYLVHSAKGTEWKNTKYKDKKPNGKGGWIYIYDKLGGTDRKNYLRTKEAVASNRNALYSIRKKQRELYGQAGKKTMAEKYYEKRRDFTQNELEKKIKANTGVHKNVFTQHWEADSPAVKNKKRQEIYALSNDLKNQNDKLYEVRSKRREYEEQGDAYAKALQSRSKKLIASKYAYDVTRLKYRKTVMGRIENLIRLITFRSRI